MGDGTRAVWRGEAGVLDRVSWPARRYLCDLLVGRHAYSRNVAHWSAQPPFRIVDRPIYWSRVHPTWQDHLDQIRHPFDQERAS